MESVPKRINRREFLTGSLVAASALTLGSPCALPRTSFEGIYTDRFTYRQGQWILVNAALQSSATAVVELRRYDTPATVSLALHPMDVSDRGNPQRPGETGADFPFAAAIDTEDLEPGIYGIHVDPQLLLPENRENNFNSFPSLNTVSRFVVTPRIPGSRSPILWVHDSLTGVCYGSFGGQSIYGSPTPGVKVSSVSYARPGLDRATLNWETVRFWREHGYDFEFIDLVELAQVPPGYLDAYRLVVMSGQFEYLPHEVMERVSEFVDSGGNLLAASNEFGIFRVRLDRDAQRLTTYKYTFEAEDPLFGSGDPRVAGVGMNIPETFYETELLGQHLWAAYQVTQGQWVDMPLYNLGTAGWILDGTGLGPGDALPAAFKNFALGQRLGFDAGGDPVIVDPELTRTFEDTVVWAATPSPNGRAWWQANGGIVSSWPLLGDGHATCTLQERPSGACVVAFASANFTKSHLAEPVYQKILLNVMQRLS